MGLFSSTPKRKSSLKARVLKAERKLAKKQEQEKLKARLEKAQNNLRKV
jgi:hypothetical protein